MSVDRLAARIRELALSFPRAYEDTPWGFPAFKVGDNRMFAWMIEEADAVHLTLKLTAEEREVTNYLPWVRRASHVGRYGWVTAAVTDERRSRRRSSGCARATGSRRRPIFGMRL